MAKEHSNNISSYPLHYIHVKPHKKEEVYYATRQNKSGWFLFHGVAPVNQTEMAQAQPLSMETGLNIVMTTFNKGGKKSWK